MTKLLSELHGQEGFAEFRLVSPSGAVRRYFQLAVDLSDAAIESVIERAGDANAYVSVIPRVRLQGTRDACGAGRAVWCDYDQLDRTPLWSLEPSAIVGTSPGKYQAYWLLDFPQTNLDEIEAINRAIARVDAGDIQATDRARVLRLPGSRNQKYPDRPLVTLQHWDPTRRYSFHELRLHYPLVAEQIHSRRPRTRDASSGWLSLVFDAVADFLEKNGYRPRLTGDHLTSLCPLHDDRRPSLSVHAERGWFCHAGCGGGRLTRLAHLLGVRL